MKVKTKAPAIAPASFDALMAQCGVQVTKSLHIAVAVSGGGDSMALACLLKTWCDANGAKLTGLIVDHGLRAESDLEAAQVKTWLSALGITAEILTYDHAKPKTGIQQAARDGRYEALLSYTQRHQIPYLALGHNLEDQAETCLMRLQRQSGLDGLAAMAAQSPSPYPQYSKTRLIRPLLPVSRIELRRVCEDYSQDWLEDPSNQNGDFTRVRLRRKIAKSSTAAQLYRFSQACRHLREYLEKTTDAMVEGVVEIRNAGYAILDQNAWQALPELFQRRVLKTALMKISGADYPPRRERFDRLYSALIEHGFKGATLQGCAILAPQKEQIYICREEKAVSPSMDLPLGDTCIWDGRFAVRAETESLRFGALGADGCQFLRDHYKKAPDQNKRFAALPYAVLKTLPAVFKGETPVFVPELDYGYAQTLKVSIDFLPYRQMKQK